MNKNLKHWHFMRFFRLALAIFSAWQAWETDQWVFYLFAIFFLVQAVFNFGCNNRGCNLPNQKQ
ncbi:hypothetical protein [Flavobacterium pedocola]